MNTDTEKLARLVHEESEEYVAQATALIGTIVQDSTRMIDHMTVLYRMFDKRLPTSVAESTKRLRAALDALDKLVDEGPGGPN